MPNMTIAEIETLMDAGFPDWRRFSMITGLTDRDITVRMPFRPNLVRAGGTISGPALMALADTASYFVTLAHAGPDVASAATANLDIHCCGSAGAWLSRRSICSPMTTSSRTRP
jgi:acyl-coenzyme A thioesterase PaaI-like protein